ncbi:MAG: cytochrome C [Pseudomonadota bacterium]
MKRIDLRPVRRVQEQSTINYQGGSMNAVRSDKAVRLRFQSIFPAMARTACLLLATTAPSHAVPSFARQTHLDCMACHVSWPELTPTGRQFKLNGYTLGEQLRLPFAGMLQVSRSSSAHVDPGSPDNFLKDRQLMLQEASLFMSGKLGEHVGIFSQATYDGLEHHTSIDNVDLRYANRLTAPGGPLLYGFTVHNNPMVQDIYNSGPTWGFPFASSGVAVTPNAATAIESLGQQVAGMGAYGLWRNTLYSELSFYRTADRLFSVLRAGTDKASDAALKGYNPYWRLALQHEWADGRHSAMLGAYGLTVDRFPDNTVQSGPTDRFVDVGWDAQYQYITDQHRASAQLNYIRENQHWNASAQSNPVDTLHSFRAKATYYYQKKYGATLSHFSTSGSSDNSLYNSGDPITGSANASPNSSGLILELNYLPKRDVRITLQYTAYRRFNGGRNNYDGFGRNAGDNNTLYLLGWFMF